MRVARAPLGECLRLLCALRRRHHPVPPELLGGLRARQRPVRRDVQRRLLAREPSLGSKEHQARRPVGEVVPHLDRSHVNQHGPLVPVATVRVLHPERLTAPLRYERAHLEQARRDPQLPVGVEDRHAKEVRGPARNSGVPGHESRCRRRVLGIDVNLRVELRSVPRSHLRIAQSCVRPPPLVGRGRVSRPRAADRKRAPRQVGRFPGAGAAPGVHRRGQIAEELSRRKPRADASDGQIPVASRGASAEIDRGVQLCAPSTVL